MTSLNYDIMTEIGKRVNLRRNMDLCISHIKACGDSAEEYYDRHIIWEPDPNYHLTEETRYIMGGEWGYAFWMTLEDMDYGSTDGF